MRRQHGWSLAVAAAMTLIVSPCGWAQQWDAKAAAIMAAAREALGGGQQLPAVKSLSLRASYRREGLTPEPGGGGRRQMFVVGPGGGSPQMSGEIEIDVLFPDKYIKVDTGTGPIAVTRTDGFDADRPLVSVQSHSPHVRIHEDSPAADPARARVAVERARADLARLLLGLLAGTQPGFTVAYTYVGEAESPDGRAHAIDVAGPAGFAARLFLDVETHLPLMLTYVAPEPRMITRTVDAPGGRPPAGAAGRQRGAAAAPELTPEEREQLDKERQALEAQPPRMAEYRLFFSDYRQVSGLLLPHRIVRGTAAATTEEWEVRSYKVNPSIEADRFTVS